MRALISLEGESGANEMAGASRWMVSYADFVTLLFVLFIVLYVSVPKVKPTAVADTHPESTASSKAEQQKMQAELQEALQGLVESGDVSLTTREDGVLLEIKDTALFSSGTAQLARASEEVILSLVQTLQAKTNRLVIEGHTDNVPIQTAVFPSNWELSAGRSAAFVRALQEQGIEATRLAAAGYADTRPKADNATLEGRSKNRRVSVLILNM
ncbi:MAG: OmpA family protein [Agitococcus sp.]|nr:OmpA family protein [Agitococcus sp.]